jgi:hypothetical protein
MPDSTLAQTIKSPCDGRGAFKSNRVTLACTQDRRKPFLIVKASPAVLQSVLAVSLEGVQ